MTGHSVHNQRIERLWVDVFGGCMQMNCTCFACIMFFYPDLTEIYNNFEISGITILFELNIIVHPSNYIYNVFLLIILVGELRLRMFFGYVNDYNQCGL